MDLKFFVKYAKHLASACMVVALLLFIPACITHSRGLAIFLMIVIGCFLAWGLFLFYVGYRGLMSRKNYFLYDEALQKNIPAADLTAERVLKLTDLYLAQYTEDTLSLWQELPAALRRAIAEQDAFRPLVCYRMLYALSMEQGAQAAEIFVTCDEKTVAFICRALNDVGDERLANYLFELKKGGEAAKARVTAFFGKNSIVIKERMLTLVQQRPRRFDMREEQG